MKLACKVFYMILLNTISSLHMTILQVIQHEITLLTVINYPKFIKSLIFGPYFS